VSGYVMGYVMAFGACFFCKRPFAFNPNTVPSTPPSVHPEREPICADCMDYINEQRRARGIPALPIPADAYEPAEA
jgi:hypothetical protein